MESVILWLEWDIVGLRRAIIRIKRKIKLISNDEDLEKTYITLILKYRNDIAQIKQAIMILKEAVG